MNRIAACILLFLFAPPIQAQTAADEKANEFFSGKGPVPTLKIEVDKTNLDMLKKDGRKYVRAIIRNDTVVYRDVGIHLKGAAGSSRTWDDKPALTINSNKFKKGMSFNGMDKFHLNNSVQDGSYFNELITGDMFLAAGVPSPRSAHVMVELNGRKVGLYVLKEGFDEMFLGRHFSDRYGNLYDGGFLRDIDQDLELDKKLDLDKFYAFWAIEVLCCDWDGYTRNRNNYRVYHDPKTDKFVFFAHGKDQMFGNSQDALIHGWGGLCARRLYETEEGQKRYIKTLKEVFEKHYDLKKINERIDSLTPRVVEALGKVNKEWAQWFKDEARNEKQRIKDRYDWVKKELPKLK